MLLERNAFDSIAFFSQCSLYKVKSFLGRREANSRPAIVKLVQKFELLEQVSDVKNQTHACRARTPANIASVAHSVKETRGLFIPRRSLELDISQTTLHRILWPELEDMEVDDVYFQQHDATCHTSGQFKNSKRRFVPH